MSRLARIVSTALITAALVLASELALTLAWSEPVTNFSTWSEQRDAGDDLARRQREFELPNGEQFDPGAVPGLADRLERTVRAGDAIGRLKIPRIDLSRVAVQGTDTESLMKGPGHYPRKSFPGQPGTVAIAGHRTTYGAPFRYINRVDRGDEIVLEMPYATFTYEFEEQRIVPPSDIQVVRDVAYPRLVLTACHPPFSAAERIVIFARLAKVGPPENARAKRLPSDLQIGGLGLGPTLAALGSLLLISVLMWFFSRGGPGARPGPGRG